ncbi:MAG: YdcF family protein [Mariprofundaceae bacterium]
MLLLSKAISQLILPPAVLILLGILGVVFWKKRWGRGCVVVSLALFWMLSTEPVRDILLDPLESQYPVLNIEQLNTENTAIILLGGGIYEDAPEYGGVDQLSNHAMMRTLYAADIAEKSGLNVYATGGRPLSEENEAEGDIMRRWLIRLGVPEQRVFAESFANNTWENAAYMRTMLEKKDVDKIVLVTTAWHMPRSVWSFEAHGFTVIPAPCTFLTKQKDYDLRSYLPHWGVFNDSALALHEYLVLFWYRLRY